MIDLVDVINAFATGLGLWVFTWGMNRIYLRMKSFLS